MVRRQKVVGCGWSLGLMAKDAGDCREEVAHQRRNRLDLGVVVNLSRRRNAGQDVVGGERDAQVDCEVCSSLATFLLKPSYDFDSGHLSLGFWGLLGTKVQPLISFTMAASCLCLSISSSLCSLVSHGAS